MYGRSFYNMRCYSDTEIGETRKIWHRQLATIIGRQRLQMMTPVENEEVSRNMTGEADGKNPGVDSTDGVMHI